MLGQTQAQIVMILGRREGLYRVIELKQPHVTTCLSSSQLLKVSKWSDINNFRSDWDSESDDTGEERRVIQGDRTEATTCINMPSQQSVTEGKVNGLIVTVRGQTGTLRVMILGRRKGLYRVMELKHSHVTTCLFSSQLLKVK